MMMTFMKKRKKKKEKKGKHIFIETQLDCVLGYTHNFQISAFALHIKIFLYVNEAFSYANP